MFKFEHPALLAILILAVILVGRLIIFRKGVSVRISASLVIRCLILTLLIFSLSGFQIRTQGGTLSRIYILDNSESVFLDSAQVIKEIKSDFQSLKPGDKTGVVIFGRDASIEITPAPPSRIGGLQTFNSQVNQSGSNIERALLTAGNLLKDANGAKEVFLFSDGNQTEGNALRAAAELARNNTTIFSIPTGPRNFSDIKVWCNEPILENRPGEGIKIKFTIQSTVDTEATADIYRDKIFIRQFNGLKLFRNQSFELDVYLPELNTPFSQYEIRVSTKLFDEFYLRNNYASVLVRRKDKPIISFIGDSQNSSLAKIIKTNKDFELAGDSGASSDIIPLCDIIIMDNYPLGPNSSNKLSQAIAAAVSNGKGLFISGGPNSFGLGRYSNSIIEEISPVWAAPQESLALSIILDASGSMAEPSGFPDKDKFRIASDALEQTLSLLNKQDALEVIAFNQGFDTIYPMSAETEKDKLHQALLKIKPNGSTSILPPIRQATRSLTGTKAAKRHIIILSDGYSTGGESAGDFQETGRLLKESGISISTIATGEKTQDQPLLALSQNQTNGKFYHILWGNDINALGKSIKEDLAQKKELYRQETVPVPVQITDSAEMLKGMPAIPFIFGYNRTDIKDRANIAAFIKKDGTKQIPLITSWQYGQGKVLAFTSSLSPNWAGNWLDWSNTPQLLTQVLRWLTPAYENPGNYRLNTSLDQSNSLRISIQSLSPAKTEFNYSLSALFQNKSISAGQLPRVSAHDYEKTIPNLDQGTYYLNIRENSQPILTRPLIIPYEQELMRFGPDLTLLKNIAESTGGTLLNTTKEYHNAGIQGKSYKKIDTFLVLASLILFILDLLLKVVFHKSFIPQAKN
ncbi:MAG: VWA domain-containing protein [Candidatus Brocadiia bacterium]